MAEFDWLKTEHPIYAAWKAEWRKNERRLRGGAAVLAEVRPFLWEDKNGDHIRGRRNEAVYVNWPEAFAKMMTGHLLREAPTPDGGGLDFGTLGPVARSGRDPSYAELVYYNADGSGQDGSEWDAWWMAADQRAMATGHRWIFAEGAPFAPASLDDILYRGARPYLVEFSPLAVPFWHFENGRLMCAICRVSLDSPRLNDRGEAIEGLGKAGYLLLTAQGFNGFGEAFAGGGWWVFDHERERFMVDGPPETEGGEPTRRWKSGDWTFTGGEIPMAPLYWERDTGDVDLGEENGEPILAMSKPALSELGQLAVSEMNLESAADFDAWEAGGSEKFFVNISEKAMQLAAAKREAGSQWVPLLSNEDGTEPKVIDGSSGAVSAEVYTARITSKREQARFLALQHATSVPDSSGASKEAGFNEGKSPRLALAAKYLQQCQNTMIRFLELRFGFAQPSGSVIWPLEYDLRDTVEDINDLFALETLSGYKSPTLGARLMVTAASEKGFITEDADRQAIEAEYKTAAEERRKQAERAGQAFAEAGIAE